MFLRSRRTLLPLIGLALCSAGLPAQAVPGVVQPLTQPGGCGSPGIAVLGAPEIGSTINTVAQWFGFPVGPSVAVFVIDLGGPAWNGLLPPQPLAPLAAALPSLVNCDQIAAFDIVQIAAFDCGPQLNLCAPPLPPCPICAFVQVGSSLTIPDLQGLVGFQFRLQHWVVNASGEMFISEGVEITVGRP